MKAPEAEHAGSNRYLSSGPVVWVVTIFCTTLLLALLKQALWLCVPLLLAIIVCYALSPVVRRLTLAGLAWETAAAIVAGGFFIAAALAMVPMLSWLAAHAARGEEAFFHYLEAGQMLIDRTLTMLESQFRFLGRVGLHDTIGGQIAKFGGTYLKEHLTDALLAAATWLPALLLAPFIAFFFLRDGGRFFKFLSSAVPNAYFERTLYMIERVDTTARAYFQGLLKLTFIDTICLAFGLAVVGVPGALGFGLMAAVLAWVPIVGEVIACAIMVLVTAADFPGNPWIVYAAVAMFLFVRLLDNFVFTPLTVGRSLRMHPLPTVLLILVGGAVAGIPGLILALPLAGVVMVVVGTIGGILNDPRLRARHAFARALQAQRITADLQR